MCWRRHERDEHGRRCVRDVRNEVLLRLGHCFPLPPQRVDIGHHRRHSGTCASRMIDDRFFDFSVCLSLRARPQSPSVLISSQLPGKHDSLATSCILPGMFWKIRWPVVRFRTVPRPTWVMLRDTAGENEGTEPHTHG